MIFSVSRHTFAASILVAASTCTASAQIEIITQRFVLSQPFAPLAAVDFFAQVDLSTISGVGSESAVITASSIRLLQRVDESSPFVIYGAGELDTPGDPYADEPLNLRAEFLDGVFADAVRIIDDPNSTGRNLLQVTNSTGFAGFFSVDGFDATYGPTILDLLSYGRESSTITPTPATAIVFGLGGVFACRRRRTDEQIACNRRGATR